MNKKVLSLGLAAVAVLSLAACGNRNKSASTSDAKTDLKVAIITDTGGVDDKSFNQSAWEGLQSWGKSKGLTKDKGFTYFQSASESDYTTNLDSAISGGYKLIYGVGFALHNAISESAKNNDGVNYVLIDDVIDNQKNVFSATFMDNEASYLAGVAAAETTKTNKVGFVGGTESEVIKRFEVGFKAGVASVNPDIKVDIQYAGAFNDAAKGKTIAATQYKSGADVVFQAAGGTGAGVFSEAKAINEGKNEADKVWVLGVDRDQKAEGNYKSKDGKDANFVLASTLKKVGQIVKTVSDQAADKKFEGGKHVAYGIKDGSVDLINDNLSDKAVKAVEEARKAIKSGDVKVPEK